MKAHFIFAGGAAVGAVAALASKAGFEVSACEKLNPDSPFFLELAGAGVKTFASENPNHVDQDDILVVSAATEKIDPENGEVAEAKRRNIPILLAEEFLARYLLPDKFVLAVSGTNGKSTTTAMLSWILEKAGYDPSAMVGAIVPIWRTNYRAGKSKYFVLEADEYFDKFLLYQPNLEIITNIELDHPDYFPTQEAVQASFEKFAEGLAEEGKIILGPVVKLNSKKEQQIAFNPRKLNLKVAGEHNQIDANLALEAALEVGVDESVATKALGSFEGVSRRFELVGEEKGVKVFDDYAHHPSAVAATLAAAREKFPREKIWAVFQPHTYSRVEKLFDDFVEALDSGEADEIILLPIFASRETGGRVSSMDLTKEIKKKEAHYMENFEQAATYIAKNASVGDVVLVLGAGDVYKLSGMLLKKLANKG